LVKRDKLVVVHCFTTLLFFQGYKDQGMLTVMAFPDNVFFVLWDCVRLGLHNTRGIAYTMPNKRPVLHACIYQILFTW
ncbi:MAG: hypothetical protein IKH57_17385, partial [Clostridia bacterium]|nr:hypothetical protein [Clostridia bacterium]